MYHVYLAVTSQVTSEMTAEVDGVIVNLVVLDGPQLFATKRRPGGVYCESERLGGQILAVVVDQSDLPRRRLTVVLRRRRGTPGRHLTVHRHAIRHDVVVKHNSTVIRCDPLLCQYASDGLGDRFLP